MPVAGLMTADEFLELEYEGRRTQLIDGVVVVNEPGPLHQMVLRTVFLAISNWCSAAPGRGLEWLPLDVRIDERNVFGPDLLWYAEGRGPRRDGGRPSPTPDLAVEVRSPSTWRYDIGAKLRHYEDHGLAELWLVDTAADVVLVFRRSAPAAPTFDVSLELGRGDVLASPAMPGFALQLDALFADADG
ncbi:MAG: Uma2 family endonuclease [Solirubrobacteraceae bacterium]